MRSYRSCDFIKRLVITEKTLKEGFGGRIIVCEVDKKVDKLAIKSAIEDLFEVRVDKVRTLIMHAKAKFIKGRKGRKAAFKKAYITLKKGYSIPELTLG